MKLERGDPEGRHRDRRKKWGPARSRRGAVGDGETGRTISAERKEGAATLYNWSSGAEGRSRGSAKPALRKTRKGNTNK